MKTIIEMAGKAFETPGVEPAFRNGFWTVTSEELERFAALVRADEREVEREACAKVCEELGMATNGIYERNHECATAIRASGQSQVCCEEYNTCVRPCTPRGRHHGQEEEREACAKLVDHILKEGGGTWGDAIRARGNA